MGYQEAANIRKKKLSDTIAGRLAEGEGIGSSFTKSISERTKANMTGFKQKVDYLNIAKKLTGGSNLAPALLGRLTGRNSDSIRFFSGKGSAKPVSDKATKIEGGGSEQVEAMQETLDEIYGFLKDTREENEQKKVEAEGKKEEIELEKKRKHDELMKLLGVDTNVPTATKVTPEEKDTTPFDKLLAMLNDKLAELEEKLFGKIFDKLLGKLPKLLPLYEVLTGAALPAAGVYALLLAPWLLNAYQRSEIEKDPTNPAWKDTPYAKVVRGEAKTQGEAAAQNQRNVVKEVSPQYAKDLLAAKPEFTDAELVDETGKTRSELKDWLATNPKTNLKNDKKATPVTPTQSNDTGNKQVTPEVKTPNSPVPSEPPSAKVSAVTNESQELQIPKPVVDAVNSVNNTVVNSQSTSQVATLPIPSVRNQEPTYQELVLYSTRVV